MGFFDSLVSGLGKVVNIAAPIITGLVQPTGAGAAQAVAAAVVGAEVAAAQSTKAVQLLQQTGAAIPSGIGTPLAVGAQVGAATGQIAGMAEIRTQTVVQRVSRRTGNVISEIVKQGSPFLMNAEVRGLRRVAKMIAKAHGKLPRKSGKISEAAISAAVGARIAQLNNAQCLLNGNGCPK